MIPEPHASTIRRIGTKALRNPGPRGDSRNNTNGQMRKIVNVTTSVITPVVTWSVPDFIDTGLGCQVG